MGRLVEVKITATGKHYLIGERLQDSVVALTTRPRLALKGAVSRGACSGSSPEQGKNDGTQKNFEPKPKDRRKVLTTDALIVLVTLSVGCIGLWLHNYGTF